MSNKTARKPVPSSVAVKFNRNAGGGLNYEVVTKGLGLVLAGFEERGDAVEYVRNYDKKMAADVDELAVLRTEFPEGIPSWMADGKNSADDIRGLMQLRRIAFPKTAAGAR